MFQGSIRRNENVMQNLTRAHNELFRRTPDERFGSLIELWQHCQNEKEQSVERWHPPEVLVSRPAEHRLTLAMGEDGSFGLTDWSFSQLCKLADVSKDTLNKLSPDTASRVLGETLPQGTKPLQALTMGETVRAIHGASYTRLYNADLLTMVREFATDFVPPQPAGIEGSRPSVTDDDIPFVPDPEPTPATGLYCGESRRAGILLSDRPDRMCRDRGRGLRSGFLHLEFGGRQAVGRRADVLVPGGLPESHRLGCDRSRRVQPQAHGQRPLVAIVEEEDRVEARSLLEERILQSLDKPRGHHSASTYTHSS